MAAALVPAVAFAQEATTNDTTYTQKITEVTSAYDTTFVFNRQKFDISQKGERTDVRVYKKNGSEMKKVKETEFLDGQEVEQVYITSPFIPRKTYKRRSQAYSHYPFSSLVPTFSLVQLSASSQKARKCATASRVNGGDLLLVRSSVR